MSKGFWIDKIKQIQQDFIKYSNEINPYHSDDKDIIDMNNHFKGLEITSTEKEILNTTLAAIQDLCDALLVLTDAKAVEEVEQKDYSIYKSSKKLPMMLKTFEEQGIKITPAIQLRHILKENSLWDVEDIKKINENCYIVTFVTERDDICYI